MHHYLLTPLVHVEYISEIGVNLFHIFCLLLFKINNNNNNNNNDDDDDDDDDNNNNNNNKSSATD